MASVLSTRLLGAGAALLLGVGALTTVSPVAGQTAPADPERAQQELTERLAGRTDGDLTVDRDATTGAVTFVGTEHGAPITTPTESAGSPEAAGAAFVSEFGPLFGAESPDDLEPRTVEAHDAGGANVVYDQVVDGIPVIAGELRVQVDGGGDVLSAIGELQPDLDAAGTASIDAVAAAGEAVAAVAAAREVDVATLTASAPEEWVYAPDLLGGPEVIGGPRLVWRLDVTGSGVDGPFDELVLVDATTGGIALRFDQTATVNGEPRRGICDAGNARALSSACFPPYRRGEGQGPTGDRDVDLAYEYAGDIYDFFSTRFGRDSVDGNGLALLSTVRYCPQDEAESCPWDNAQWSQTQLQMLYGAGYASADDVVGHELTHGVTQFSSSLLYYYQSGAINESLSDVFGELMDQTNGAGSDTSDERWLLGEDLPDGAVRDMRNPTRYEQPDRMTSVIYGGSTNDNGQTHRNSGVANKAAYLMVDGDTFNGRTVPRLGITRTARIFYQAATTMLGSGSDYADLSRALVQSCHNSLGTDGITTATCDGVAQAVAAVEMSTDPPRSPAPDAPGCGTGVTGVTTVLFDDLEYPELGLWTTTGSGEPWVLLSGYYATSGLRSFYAVDARTASDTAIAQTGDVLLPPRSILLFNHAYFYETVHDGGTLEYSTDGGSHWTDAGPLFTFGPYNGVAEGTPVFNGVSNGYRSSQIDLSSLAGQNFRVRFRSRTNAAVGYSGWYVDDVRIFSCPLPSPRPDALLRLATTGATVVGNNIYNTTGRDQSRTKTIGRLGTARFFARVQNDGTVAEPIKFSGPGTDAQFTVRYEDAAGANITAAVTAGTYQTVTLNPGRRVSITVTVTARAGAASGSKRSLLLQATSTSSTVPLSDVVKAKVTVGS